MFPLFKTFLISVMASLIFACGGGATINEQLAEDSATVSQQDDFSPAAPQATPASTSDSDNDSSEDTAAAEPAIAASGSSEPEREPATTGEQASPDQTQQEAETEVRQRNVPATPADITDLILVTGQSNALGAQSAFDATLDSPHEQVFAFTDQGWQKADLHQVWDLGNFPRGNPGEEPNNNLSLHMAKEIARRHGDRVVGFVLVTAPGQSITHWSPAGGFFQQLDRKVLQAINQLPHKNQLDGILWHQGENDEGDTDYHRKLDSLIENFRVQSWFSSDRPFICGETAVFEVVNRQLSALNSNGDRWSGCVGSENLQTHLDGFHFNAEGLRELGRRYAVKYLEILSN